MTFFTQLEEIFSTDIFHSFNRIRILLNTAKKKVLKEIAFYILNRSNYVFHPEREQWYLYIKDIIDTELFKASPIPLKTSALADRYENLVPILPPGWILDTL